MKGSKDVLNSVLKTAQMGQTGIRAVANAPLCAELRQELRAQSQQYNAIEREAQAIASSRGWALDSLSPVAKGMAKMAVKTQLGRKNINSGVAAMMIRGNTRGMIKGLKVLHGLKNGDRRVAEISQRLLDCETESIKQMRPFL